MYVHWSGIDTTASRFTKYERNSYTLTYTIAPMRSLCGTGIGMFTLLLRDDILSIILYAFDEPLLGMKMLNNVILPCELHKISPYTTMWCLRKLFYPSSRGSIKTVESLFIFYINCFGPFYGNFIYSRNHLLWYIKVTDIFTCMLERGRLWPSSIAVQCCTP